MKWWVTFDPNRSNTNQAAQQREPKSESSKHLIHRSWTTIITKQRPHHKTFTVVNLQIVTTTHSHYVSPPTIA
ncbi:hypothetical protein GYH30_044817 [Glycine max]|nr:hypothetical protein GYH30_044817 [Glycine max]